MNGRLYDPVFCRFFSPDNYVQMPDFSQNFNRYTYCLNNPLKYYDPDGEFFLLSIVTGFVKGVYNFMTGKDNWLSPFTTAYKYGTNDLKISWGLFKGNFKQIVTRWTWELPQTILGYGYSEFRNLGGFVDHVRYFDGATYVINETGKENGITLGSFININSPNPIPEDNGKFAPYKDPLYMHEYGHYLQSQEYGLGYLFSVGVPSLISAKDAGRSIIYNEDLSVNNVNTISSHRIKWYETSANAKAYNYFKHYGVEWDFRNYPINWHPYNNYSNLYYYEKYNINNRINNTCFSLVM